MSLYVTLDGELGQQIASNKGWADFCEWVRSLGKHYPDLLHLVDAGWDEDLEDVYAQLEHALHRDTPYEEPTRMIGLALLMILKDRGSATVLGITDGLSSE